MLIGSGGDGLHVMETKCIRLLVPLHDILGSEDLLVGMNQSHLQAGKGGA